MILTSWQMAYGNVHVDQRRLRKHYASGIETLLPGALTFNQLFTTGKAADQAVRQRRGDR